ncbi:MAG: peptide ABC transporter substrate-binding protein [Chloroflexi bacterium]|nr:peptide ABC transporter substrate-binding protein [Chloroflexota bacterium]
MISKREWLIVGTFVILILALLGVGGFIVFRLASERGLIPLATSPLDDQTPSTSPEAVPSPESERATENVLRVPGTPPITLDPALAQDSGSIEYIRLIYSGLVTFDAELNVVPDIAESWEVSPDGRTYSFHLRQNVRFHDGRQATAQDFKYAIERACDPATGSPTARDYLGDILGVREKLAGEAGEVAGVVVVDDFTLEITLQEPVVYFLAKLTYPTAFLVDRTSLESGESILNGTGPFKWGTSSLERISLLGNKEYYRGAVGLEKLEFILSGDFLPLYEQGQLDYVQVGAADIERVKDPDGPFLDELSLVPGLSTYYIGFNLNISPYDDPDLRRALAYATPKSGLVDLVLGGTVVEAWGILPPGMPGYNPDLAGIPFDPDKATALLEGSQFGGGEGLPPLILASADPGLAQILADSYAEILGINVEVQAMDFSSLLAALGEGEVGMFLLGWGADYVDPQNFLEINFHSVSQGNYTRYSQPEVDSLLEGAREEQDRERRLDLYRQAEEIIVQDVAWIPLFHDLQYILVKPYVQNLVVTPLGPMYSLARVEGFSGN